MRVKENRSGSGIEIYGNSQIVLVHSLCMHDFCSVPVCTCAFLFAYNIIHTELLQAAAPDNTHTRKLIIYKHTHTYTHREMASHDKI